MRITFDPKRDKTLAEIQHEESRWPRTTAHRVVPKCWQAPK
jgi:hypothetical protein